MEAIAVNDVAVPAQVIEEKKHTVGSKLAVWHNRADKTAGGLKRKDLKLNRNGIVVSRKASAAAAKSKNLGKFQFPVKPVE
jgi:hypothetical protein